MELLLWFQCTVCYYFAASTIIGQCPLKQLPDVGQFKTRRSLSVTSIYVQVHPKPLQSFQKLCKLLFPSDQRVLTCKGWLFATASFITWAHRGSSILHILTRVTVESADNSQLCVAFIKFTFKEDSYLCGLHASASLDFLANHEMKNSGTSLPSGSQNVCVWQSRLRKNSKCSSVCVRFNVIS